MLHKLAIYSFLLLSRVLRTPMVVRVHIGGRCCVSGVCYINQATVDTRGAILLYLSIFISLRLPHEGVPGLCSQGLFRND